MAGSFRKRVLTCVQFRWASWLYAGYVVAFTGVYISSLVWPHTSSLLDVLKGLWFAPALAAFIISRRVVNRLQDEEEAVLALVEFVGRHGYFCTVAKLTFEALVLFGAASIFMIFTSIFFKDAAVSLIYGLALFTILYSKVVSRELEKLRKDLALLAKIREAHEKVKL